PGHGDERSPARHGSIAIPIEPRSDPAPADRPRGWRRRSPQAGEKARTDRGQLLAGPRRPRRSIRFPSPARPATPRPDPTRRRTQHIPPDPDPPRGTGHAPGEVRGQDPETRRPQEGTGREVRDAEDGSHPGGGASAARGRLAQDEGPPDR